MGTSNNQKKEQPMTAYERFEKEFAARLSKLRIEKGVSARDMSLSLGQNAGYINRIENGKSLPSMHVFYCICDYFNIDPMDFFAQETKNPQQVNRIIDYLIQLDDKKVSHIEAVLEDLVEVQQKG